MKGMGVLRQNLYLDRIFENRWGRMSSWDDDGSFKEISSSERYTRCRALCICLEKSISVPSHTSSRLLWEQFPEDGESCQGSECLVHESNHARYTHYGID